MRILHTADWHLGKIVNEFSMLDLQAEYLNNLIEQVQEYEVDAVIMAGDLYDRAIPPKEAVSLANRVFTELTQRVGVPVLVISGNHDSNERVEYGSELLAGSQLYIEGTTKASIRKVTLKNVNFYLVPYDDYRNIRNVMDKEAINHPEDALRAQLATIEDEWNEDEVNVLLYHGFVIHTTEEEIPEESDSERPLSIGTVEYIPADLVDAFDYVALGHLHKAQKIKTDTIRYSGSPLKYSKSEANHRKQHLLVDLSKDKVQITPVEIKTSRDLRVVRGLFEEVQMEESDDFIFFELEDTSYVMDAMSRLRKQYPNTMGLEYVNHKVHETLETNHSKEQVQKSELDELFSDFYEHHIGMPLNEQQQAAMIHTLKQVKEMEENQ